LENDIQSTSKIQLITSRYVGGTFTLKMTTAMKMAVFWDVAPCSLVDIDRLMMEAISSSEM
jgi:hypothetical protein